MLETVVTLNDVTKGRTVDALTQLAMRSSALADLVDLTNASKPCGACMTELGCSSSSDLAFRASEAALAVSSYNILGLLSLSCSRQGQAHTFNAGSVDLEGAGDRGGMGVGSKSSFSMPVSSMSVVSVPFEDVAIGDGSGMSLGLEASGET